jgi:hypothetical protein
LLRDQAGRLLASDAEEAAKCRALADGLTHHSVSYFKEQFGHELPLSGPESEKQHLRTEQEAYFISSDPAYKVLVWEKFGADLRPTDPLLNYKLAMRAMSARRDLVLREPAVPNKPSEDIADFPVSLKTLERQEAQANAFEQQWENILNNEGDLGGLNEQRREHALKIERHRRERLAKKSGETNAKDVAPEKTKTDNNAFERAKGLFLPLELVLASRFQANPSLRFGKAFLALSEDEQMRAAEKVIRVFEVLNLTADLFIGLEAIVIVKDRADYTDDGKTLFLPATREENALVATLPRAFFKLADLREAKPLVPLTQPVSASVTRVRVLNPVPENTASTAEQQSADDEDETASAPDDEKQEDAEEVQFARTNWKRNELERVISRAEFLAREELEGKALQRKLKELADLKRSAKHFDAMESGVQQDYKQRFESVVDRFISEFA